MSNQQHKSTPWKVGAIESGMVAIYSEDDKEVTGFIDPEDAQRILACVNACAGIPTEALEDGGIDKSALGCAVKIANDAIKQRDELLAAIGSQAAKDVIAERHRQQAVEGWTPAHDDQHNARELSAAAECYAGAVSKHDVCPAIWPWDEAWWKPQDYRRNLVKAGALILAEIERIDRAAIASEKGGAA